MSYQATRTYKRPILVTANPCSSSSRSGLSGGLDPPSAECPQPVHTNERDALLGKLNEITRAYMGGSKGLHWHEGHPDVRAWLDDLIPRMIGLTQRPKLLRCSSEARHKADEWIKTFHWVGSQIRQNGSFFAGGYTSVPAGGLYVRTYNLRDYNFRPGNPSGFTPGSAAEAASKPAALPVVKTEGVPFSPTVGGAGGDPTKSGANRVTAIQQAAIDAGILEAPGTVGAGVPGTTGGGARNGSSPAPGVDYSGGGAGAGGGAFGLPATVAGVPTSLILLGGGAVLMRMLK